MRLSPAAEFPNDNTGLHLGAVWVNREVCGPPEPEVRSIEEVILSALTETPEPPPVTVTEFVQPLEVDLPEPPLELPAEAAPSEAEAAATLETIAVELASEDVIEASPSPVAPVAPVADIVAEPPAPLESMIVLRGPEGERAPIADSLLSEMLAEAAVADATEEILVEELDFDFSRVPLEGEADLESAPESATQMATPEPVVATAAEPEVEANDPYAALVKTLCDVAVAEGGAAPSVTSLLDGAEKGTAAAWRAVLRGEVDDISTCGAAMLDEWAALLVATALGNPGRATALRSELRSRGVCAFGLIDAA